MIANAGGKSIESLAINEVSILRQSRQAANISIKIIPKYNQEASFMEF